MKSKMVRLPRARARFGSCSGVLLAHGRALASLRRPQNVPVASYTVREASLPTSCKLGIPNTTLQFSNSLKGARSSQKPHAQFITMTGHIKISPEGGVRGRAQVQAAGCPLPVESCGQRSVLAAVCDKMHGVSSTRATHLGLGIQTFSSGSVMCAELMLPAPPESKRAGGPEPPPEVTLSAQPGCRGPGPR